MKVEFSDEAYLDIEDIILWYESIRKGISEDFELCLDVGIDEIIKNPDSFQIRYDYVKIQFIKRFPYGIHYYIFNDNIIRIIGVIHSSRSPNVWFKRI